MKRPLLLLMLLGAAACGSDGQDSIAALSVDRRVADESLLTEAARLFYEDHADGYDFLVFWGGAEFGPGSSFYLPVKNDVPGIGYAWNPPEFFDDAARFGSRRLQGVIWMGPDWMREEAPAGPRSVLGILSQETGHRWGASLRFLREGDDKAPSPDLLGDPYHWSFFLDTGASPLGGNDWTALGGGKYRASPVDRVEFSPLDLYLMGLLRAEEVGPLTLLTRIRESDGTPLTRFTAFSHRVAEEVTVLADAEEVTIDQIVAVEGARTPEAGYTGAHVSQAWIYLTGSGSPAPERLRELQSAWAGFYSRATGGRGTMDTELR